MQKCQQGVVVQHYTVMMSVSRTSHRASKKANEAVYIVAVLPVYNVQSHNAPTALEDPNSSAMLGLQGRIDEELRTVHPRNRSLH